MLEYVPAKSNHVCHCEDRERSERDEAIQSSPEALDCFACARNDELGPLVAMTTLAMMGSVIQVLMKQPVVYIMTSRRNGTLYTGVTSNLPQRVWQHRAGAVGGFTKRYHCNVLVWYELHSTMLDAIAREKQIKGGSRKKKLALIEAMNPAWRDLFDELL